VWGGRVLLVAYVPGEIKWQTKTKKTYKNIYIYCFVAITLLVVVA